MYTDHFVIRYNRLFLRAVVKEFRKSVAFSENAEKSVVTCFFSRLTVVFSFVEMI